MKSVDEIVAELRIQIAANLSRDVGIVSIDCDDALALCQMAADFAVMLAEGRRALADLKREADRMRGADKIVRELAEILRQSEPPTLSPEIPQRLSLAIALYVSRTSHQADDAGAVTGSDERLREALMPFRDYADVSVNEHGWINRAGNERISDWFGPADFYRAWLALSPEQQGGK